MPKKVIRVQKEKEETSIFYNFEVRNVQGKVVVIVKNCRTTNEVLSNFHLGVRQGIKNKLNKQVILVDSISKPKRKKEVRENVENFFERKDGKDILYSVEGKDFKNYGRIDLLSEVLVVRKEAMVI